MSQEFEEQNFNEDPPLLSDSADSILNLSGVSLVRWVDLTEFNDLLIEAGFGPIKGYWVKALGSKQADKAMQNGKVELGKEGETIIDLSSMKPGATAELSFMAAIKGRDDKSRLFHTKQHLQLLESLPRPVTEKAARIIREVSEITSDGKKNSKKDSKTLGSDSGTS